MALSWLHHFPSWLEVSIPVWWCNGHHRRPFWLWWSVILGLLLLSHGVCDLPLLVTERVSVASTLFSGKCRGGPCMSKRPRLAVGKEPGCSLHTTSGVVIHQEERPERKAKGKDIVWVQSVFAIFHIGSFYDPYLTLKCPVFSFQNVSEYFLLISKW